MVEPERIIMFRVPWLDDKGNILKPYSIIEANDANRNCGTLTELKINGAVDYLENIIIYQSETSSNPITLSDSNWPIKFFETIFKFGSSINVKIDEYPFDILFNKS